MTQQEQSIPTVQKVIAVLWSSFLVAAIATVLMIVFLDSKESLLNCNNLEAGRLSIYSTVFFGLWLLAAISSALTCYFRRHCHVSKLNQEEGSERSQHEQ